MPTDGPNNILFPKNTIPLLHIDITHFSFRSDEQKLYCQTNEWLSYWNKQSSTPRPTLPWFQSIFLTDFIPNENYFYTSNRLSSNRIKINICLPPLVLPHRQKHLTPPPTLFSTTQTRKKKTLSHILPHIHRIRAPCTFHILIFRRFQTIQSCPVDLVKPREL